MECRRVWSEGRKDPLRLKKVSPFHRGSDVPVPEPPWLLLFALRPCPNPSDRGSAEQGRWSVGGDWGWREGSGVAVLVGLGTWERRRGTRSVVVCERSSHLILFAKSSSRQSLSIQVIIIKCYYQVFRRFLLQLKKKSSCLFVTPM